MEQHYTIQGVKLAFPCKAYPTQISMMAMIIKGIEKRQNCLLESPTGSGKSLALLCSALGWQQAEQEKKYKAEENQDYEDLDGSTSDDDLKKPATCTCSCSKSNAQPSVSGDVPHTSTSPTETRPSTLENKAELIEVKDEPKDPEDGEDKSGGGKKKGNEDDDDFQPTKKRARNNASPTGTAKKARHQKGVVFDDDLEDTPGKGQNPNVKAHWQMKLVTPRANAVANELSAGTSKETSPCSCPCHSASASKADKWDKMDKEEEGPKRIPRIYFGTRTHKQIAQIIKELGRTAYKHVRMSILGSREHTCVHPEVSKGHNKNEGCKELLDGKNGGSCTYFSGVHKMKQQWQIRDAGLTEAWDIEDLVQLGKRKRACPYFATRALKDQADVVFCPYNYLIDPMIRGSMEIMLKDQIIVLDEAHNIEDSAREAASLTVTIEQFKDATDELDKLLTLKFRIEHTRVMHTVSSSLLHWINECSGSLKQDDFNQASRVWSGPEIVMALANMGISPGTLQTLQHHLSGLTEDEDNERGIKEMGPSLSAISAALFKSLFLIFNFLFKEDMRYTKDYKVAMLKTRAKKQFSETSNRWLQRRRNRGEMVWTISMNFWCLNPAVAFSDFSEDVRTIVLTSGTLSPMNSFASELGVAFPIQLEANHVIKSSRVWVSSLAMGPNGNSLNASYRNAETFAFQDDLGRTVLEVCRVIPYGVLCFFSSYSMMNKLMERWKNTGLYDELESLKSVMSEARGGDKVGFDEQLREFYDTIRECEEIGIENHRITGVLMFAVCRGKISEGMDFADNNARAVITVGIPYPNVKDSQVELKRKYNDQYSAARGLLTGSEWYEIQAFRALNQALGRCIRHKNDWGAILLVDERFSRNPKKYISGLSKWVRGRVDHHTHARDALASLSEFATRLMQEVSPDQDTSMIGSQSPAIMNTSSAHHSKDAPASLLTPFNFNSHGPSTPFQEDNSARRQRGNRKRRNNRGPNVGQLFVPVDSLPNHQPNVAGRTSTAMSAASTPHGKAISAASTPQGKAISATSAGQCHSTTRGPNPQQAKLQEFLIQTPNGTQIVAPSAPAAIQRSPTEGMGAPETEAPASIHQNYAMSSFVKATEVLHGTTNQHMPGGQSHLNRSGFTGQKQMEPVSGSAVTDQDREVIDLTSPVKAGHSLARGGNYHIPTPKAKLTFEDGEKVGTDSAQRGETFASKLSKFVFAKNDTKANGSHQLQTVRQAGKPAHSLVAVDSPKSEHAKQETKQCEKDSNANYNALKSLPKDERTIPSNDDAVDEDGGECGEDEDEKRRWRREQNNGTPDLFDSEVPYSSSDLPIATTPLKNLGNKTKDDIITKTDQDQENRKGISIQTPGMNEHDLEGVESRRDAVCCHGDRADEDDDDVQHKTKQNKSNLANDWSICREEKPQGSRDRLSSRSRRSLGRRKVDAEKEGEEKEQITDAHSASKTGIRRSARTRRTPKKCVETRAENLEEGGPKDYVCTDDVCCAYCHSQLLSTLQGLASLSGESCKSAYLHNRLSTEGASAANNRGNRDLRRCKCPNVANREACLLAVDGEMLEGCCVVNSDPRTGLHLNAFWSDEEQSCFQPIRCAVCESTMQSDRDESETPPVIGYKVVIAGAESGLQVGKTYLLASHVRCCNTLLDKQQRGKGGIKLWE